MSTTPDHLAAVLGREFFPALSERRQACTKPSPDAPTMVQAVTVILIDAHLLMAADDE